MEELQILSSKIRTMMENKEFPEELKNTIESVYREYEEFYEENIKPAIHMLSIEEYFNYEQKSAMQKILDNYKRECEQKGEDVIEFLQRKEEKEEQENSSGVNEEVEEIVNDSAENRYLRITKIVDIVLDSIRSNRNQLFMMLSNYTVDEKQKEEINDEIEAIKNRAIQRIENNGMEIFSLDNKEIAQQIIGEYEQYRENKEIQVKKTSHEKFVETLSLTDEQKNNIENNAQKNVEQKVIEQENKKDPLAPDFYMR